MLRNPLWPTIGLTFWLLPCALQDYRTRRVSVWLTLPLFLLAWPFSLVHGTGQITLATFMGFYLAFHLAHGGMGGADGKVAVAVAAVTPAGLAAGLAANALAFLYHRLRGRPAARVPGVVGFYLGLVATVLLEFGRALQTCVFSQ